MNTLILTFNTPKIPDCLKICYLNIPVTQYVPNPIRCYKCDEQSTMMFVLDAQLLLIKMTHALCHLSVLTVERIRNVVFFTGEIR